MFLQNLQPLSLNSFFSLFFHVLKLFLESPQFTLMLQLHFLCLLSLILKPFLHHFELHFSIIHFLCYTSLLYFQFANLLQVGFLFFYNRLLDSFCLLDLFFLLSLGSYYFDLAVFFSFFDFFLVFQRQIIDLELMSLFDVADLLFMLFPQIIYYLSIIFLPVLDRFIEFINFSLMNFLYVSDLFQPLLSQ